MKYFNLPIVYKLGNVLGYVFKWKIRYDGILKNGWCEAVNEASDKYLSSSVKVALFSIIHVLCT